MALLGQRFAFWRRNAEPRSADETAHLARAARGGDRRAFERLHELYAPMVHGILLARVSREEADDLVQDVFLIALDKLPSLREEAAFGGWLAQIARHRAGDFHRDARSRATVGQSENEHATAAVAPPSAEANEALAAIRALPEAYRETLLMRLVEGMTGPEIAARTGLSEGSVRVNLHRGLELLRARLAGEEST